jgi:undecaprenyl-diphosphatase
MSLGTSIRQSRLLAAVARGDAALFDLVCSHRNAALDRVMILLTRSGDALAYVGVALAGIAIGGDAGEACIRAAVAAGLATAIAYVPKRLVARPRPTRADPDRTALLEPPDAWSFPSSHTAAAVATACAFGAALGPAAFLAAFGWALAVGVSRVYVGAHYPLDVMIGAMLGAVVALELGGFAAGVGAALAIGV